MLLLSRVTLLLTEYALQWATLITVSHIFPSGALTTLLFLHPLQFAIQWLVVREKLPLRSAATDRIIKQYWRTTRNVLFVPLICLLLYVVNWEGQWYLDRLDRAERMEDRSWKWVETVPPLDHMRQVIYFFLIAIVHAIVKLCDVEWIRLLDGTYVSTAPHNNKSSGGRIETSKWGIEAPVMYLLAALSCVFLTRIYHQADGVYFLLSVVSVITIVDGIVGTMISHSHRSIAAHEKAGTQTAKGVSLLSDGERRFDKHISIMDVIDAAPLWNHETAMVMFLVNLDAPWFQIVLYATVQALVMALTCPSWHGHRHIALQQSQFGLRRFTPFICWEKLESYASPTLTIICRFASCVAAIAAVLSISRQEILVGPFSDDPNSTGIYEDTIHENLVHSMTVCIAFLGLSQILDAVSIRIVSLPFDRTSITEKSFTTWSWNEWLPFVTQVSILIICALTRNFNDLLSFKYMLDVSLLLRIASFPLACFVIIRSQRHGQKKQDGTQKK